MFNYKRMQRAFTLIELLVVIIILAILAAVVVPNVLGHTETARKAAAKSDIARISEQLEIYKSQLLTYPTEEQGLNALVQNMTNSNKWQGPYLKYGVPTDPWNNSYQYKNPGQHGEFDLFTTAPDGEVIGNWTLQDK